MLLVLVMLAMPKNNLSDFTFGENYNYFMYLNQQTFTAQNCTTVSSGNLLIIKTQNQYAKYVFSMAQNVEGEAVEITTTNTKQALNHICQTLNAKYVDFEQVGEIEIYYFYSPNLQNYVLKQNNKINLQVAVHQNIVIAGYPLILHSF